MIVLDAIVFTSMTGHTERYARLLSEKISIPAFCLSTQADGIPKGAKIIYMAGSRRVVCRGMKRPPGTGTFVLPAP